MITWATPAAAAVVVANTPLWVSSLPPLLTSDAIEIALLASAAVMVTTPADDVAVTLALVSLLPALIAAAMPPAVVATSSAEGAVTLIVSTSAFARRSVPAKLLTPFHWGSLAIFTRLAGSLSVLNHNSA